MNHDFWTSVLPVLVVFNILSIVGYVLTDHPVLLYTSIGLAVIGLIICIAGMISTSAEMRRLQQ